MANLPWMSLISAFHVICFLLVAWHCLRNRREANSALLWIFLAWSVPLLGPLMYLAVGIDRVPRKAFRKHIINERLRAEREAREDPSLPLAYWRAVHEAVTGCPTGNQACELDAAIQNVVPEHPLLGGNRIQPLVDGDETYPRMLDAIRNAKHHIHLQSFIIYNDPIGREFLSLLAARARSGVQVRVLYDRFGSTWSLVSGLFRRHQGTPNLQISGWTQANPLKRQLQINLRNHRKTLVVDGRTAFCGGINIHEENVSQGDTPPMRDYHFQIEGPAVQEMQYAFLRDWYFMTDENPDQLLTSDYFPHVEASGDARIRVINSGPSSELEAMADVFFLSIISARKQVLIATPYFVPPRDIVRALRSAALRGVDVRLILPLKNNHFYAGWAGKALYEELLATGVKIFERRAPFTHAKALIVDDAMALVGTANLDVRSLQLNYETNLAVFDDNFINKLKGIVLADEAQSDELDLHAWRQRSVPHRVLENLAYLMMPVL